MTNIYIDTNVFLDFYQAATDRMVVFRELMARVESIVVPEQTIMEFRRNRAKRLIQLADQVEKSARVSIHTTSVVRELPDFDQWAKARDTVKLHAKRISDQLKKWAHDDSSDPVYQEFVKLYVHGTTISTPIDAVSKAQTGKLLGAPPTSPDKHTIGDEVIWETLLQACDSNLIVVSRDRTFLDNEAILKSEFRIDGKRELIAITGSLAEALKLIGKPSAPIELEEKTEINTEISESEALRTGRCPICNVRMEEVGYEGSDGDSAWWLSCPKCRYEAFP